MKSTDSEPRFIEPGDDQDECLALPLYVTRQIQSRFMLEFERCVPGTLTNIAVLKHRSKPGASVVAANVNGLTTHPHTSSYLTIGTP